MTTPADQLNDLVAVLRAGADFYRTAVERIDDERLEELFREMAAIREHAITELTPLIARTGERTTASGSLVGAAEAFYARALSLIGDPADAHVGRLEEQEERTLAALEEARRSVTTRDARIVLDRQLGVFRDTHDRMRALKHGPA